MTFVTARELIEIELDAAQRQALFERARHVVSIEWFGRCIAACFDEPAAADSFRNRYQSFLKPGNPDLWSCALQKGNDAGEPIFWTEPGRAYRYPAQLRAPHVISFLADAVTHRAFFDVNSELVSFHAAAVRIGDAAAAISAISTGGKSTTALACSRRGMDLYSDERCVLKAGMVQPFPRAINVRQGGVELLTSEEIPGDGGIGGRLRAHEGADWESASFADVLGDRPMPHPAKLEALFFIDGRGALARVTPLTLDDAIVRLLTAGLAGPGAGLDRVATATALCRQARVFALTMGTPDDTALLIAATTRRARPLVAVGI
jgi:hypothetical protein